MVVKFPSEEGAALDFTTGLEVYFTPFTVIEIVVASCFVPAVLFPDSSISSLVNTNLSPAEHPEGV